MTDIASRSPAEERVREVRIHIFEVSANTGKVPTPEQIATELGHPVEAIHACLDELANGKVIIKAPYGHNIWAANPFCAVPTDFKVVAGGRT